MGYSRPIWIVVAGVFLLAGASEVSAEIYRYMDEQGQMHAVADLDSVPAQYRQAALEDAQARSGGSLNIVGDANEDPPAAQVPAPGPAKSPGAPGSPAASEIGGHDQSWWRSQARDREDKLRELKAELELAREDEAEYSDQIYRRPGTAGPGKPGPGPRRHRGQGRAAVLSAADDTYVPSIEQLEQGVAEAESALEIFHDEARHLGVPPGWLR